MKSEKDNPEKLVKWRSFPGRMYAEMVAEVLKKENIHCIIKGDDAGILGASSVAEYSPGKTEVWVLEKNRERAEQIAFDMLDHI